MEALINQLITNYLDPLILAVITVVILPRLNAILKAHHLGLLEGMIDHKAQGAIMSAVNKAATQGGQKVSEMHWMNIVAPAVGSLVKAHPGLSQEDAEGYVHAAMLKLPGIGPVDLKRSDDGGGKGESRIIGDGKTPEPGDARKLGKQPVVIGPASGGQPTNVDLPGSSGAGSGDEGKDVDERARSGSGSDDTREALLREAGKE